MKQTVFLWLTIIVLGFIIFDLRRTQDIMLKTEAILVENDNIIKDALKMILIKEIKGIENELFPQDPTADRTYIVPDEAKDFYKID